MAPREEAGVSWTSLNFRIAKTIDHFVHDGFGSFSVIFSRHIQYFWSLSATVVRKVTVRYEPNNRS
jgi:hypothetical protein